MAPNKKAGELCQEPHNYELNIKAYQIYEKQTT